MKKYSVILVLLVVAVALVVTGCAKKAEVTQTPAAAAVTPIEKPEVYQDGVYFTLGEEFESSGWKYAVTITVTDGKIVDVDWNGVNVNGGPDKKTLDKSGNYNMVKFGGAIAEWYEQAERVEAYLVETQNPLDVVYSDAEGHVDSISGVTVTVDEFFRLAQVALAQGPVGSGSYANGAYYASAADFHEGWKDYVSVTVVNGFISSVNWNAVNEEGVDKKSYDRAGNYNMMKFGGAIADWYEQAEAAELYVVKTQNTDVALNADGSTDEISGATISVDGFVELLQQALAAGPQ
ncbi:MAG: FMN-binding protein [Sphaerochaetaceae bacterium]|jgi:major membrane immunogen (membrane-anchored lipoprotein)